MNSNDKPTPLPGRRRGTWLAYNLATGVLLPVWGPWAAWRLTRGNSRPGREERLGYGVRLEPSENRVWIHGASVGEMAAVRPIAERFHAMRPDAPVVVSTITPTGQEAARKAFDWAESVRYFPLDLPGPVGRSLRAVGPEVVALAETELWPNFLYEASANARIVLLNGRISDRTFGPAKKARSLYAWMLSHLSVLGMQTEADAERVIALGAPEERVRVIGISKFDEDVPTLTTATRDHWRRELGLGPDPVAIAGSTFPGEDEAVIAACMAARRIQPNLKLIVAPRHIERAVDVERAAQAAGLRSARRSQGPDPRADVIILDTFGELASVYGLADVAFIGKSLTDRGGQNLIQPMAHGIPVVFGPNMQNFRDVAAQAELAGAAVRVESAEALAEAWTRLLGDPNVRDRMGSAGQLLVNKNRGASDRYARILEEALDT